jgi:hypothetical protein
MSLITLLKTDDIMITSKYSGILHVEQVFIVSNSEYVGYWPLPH